MNVHICSLFVSLIVYPMNPMFTLHLTMLTLCYIMLYAILLAPWYPKKNPSDFGHAAIMALGLYHMTEWFLSCPDSNVIIISYLSYCYNVLFHIYYSVLFFPEVSYLKYVVSILFCHNILYIASIPYYFHIIYCHLSHYCHSWGILPYIAIVISSLVLSREWGNGIIIHS